MIPLLHNCKNAYALWFKRYSDLGKAHRRTLGQRIDDLFIDTIEAISVASFTPKADKLPALRVAIRKLDTMKILLMILWENKSLKNDHYLELSIKLENIGKMLGGWHNKILKPDAPKLDFGA
ncbi:TPA: hypothetical protein DEP96_00665 [Candidatus Uhrbacteria bacterium]|nr:hypothetical protein [Candidatus Uhrbacteria bacterium]